MDRFHLAMNAVLVVNTGSTSLKLSVLDSTDTVTDALELHPWDGSADHDQLRDFVTRNQNVAATGHRIVHGGSRFTAPALVNDTVRAALADLTSLAPLHQAWRRMDTRPPPVMVWTPEHVGRFLDAIWLHRLCAVYHLIAFRGFRRSEVCGLEWEDVSFSSRMVAINRGRVQMGWETEEGDTKSEASDDVVTLDKHSCTILRDWKKRQSAEALKAGQAYQRTPKVFTDELGVPYHPARITVIFEWLAFDGGLPPIRLHTLRHVAASLARHAGGDMKVRGSGVTSPAWVRHRLTVDAETRAWWWCSRCQAIVTGPASRP